MKAKRIAAGIATLLILAYLFFIGSWLVAQLYAFMAGWGGWLLSLILAGLLLIGFIAFFRLLRFTLGLKQLEIPDEH